MRLHLLFQGNPVTVKYHSGLRDTAGNPAHAATLIRQRLITLDPQLKVDPAKHESILLHEFFHFVWVRLGNDRRFAWEDLLRDERSSRARGEAGWSSEWRKNKLLDTDSDGRSRRWREYCCESFCDTAAWVHSGHDSEVTLALTHRHRRAAWFHASLGPGSFPI